MLRLLLRGRGLYREKGSFRKMAEVEGGDDRLCEDVESVIERELYREKGKVNEELFE
jgi:hypothetical protein